MAIPNQLIRFQCIQYALDRPGVLSVVPGVRGMEDLKDLLGFVNAPAEEKDYSVIGRFTPAAAEGSCVYCNHCLPCPAGIDVGLVNKYYDLAQAGDQMAAGHYQKLTVQAASGRRRLTEKEKRWSYRPFLNGMYLWNQLSA